MKDPSQILLRPVISEKSYAGMAQQRYVFRVATDANKIEIKQAVESAFKVKAASVNVLIVKGKVRTRMKRGGRVVGRSRDWKKAIVTLQAGETIANLFEGV
ncbi:MAG: 50S ribosomal protein L23 [Candidatus Dormibacteraeota bacterium]|jgi:large subunit ribosomal protein L23|nr:50S ribosomal protein L23 [Candidatus Dormibacteraeota bacterium]